jgi:hypothetical protein
MHRLLLITAVTFVMFAPVVAQSRPAQPRSRPAQTKPALPRAPDGHPDLEGTWSNATVTPLERPKGFEDRSFFSEAETPAFQKAVLEGIVALLGELEVNTSAELDEIWNEPGNLISDRRTSLIVDPSSGKIPALLKEARIRIEAAIQRHRDHPADGPEDRTSAERCIVWENQGAPPMLPPPYNPHLQIVQTRDFVVILTEMFHDARIVPLDGRPHLPGTPRSWRGDSRGRWQDDSLVVETTNFRLEGGGYSRFYALNGADEQLKVTERFTRIDADTILYRFTVDDPTAYMQPWSAELPLTRTEEPIFEFACHEGNYAMVDILRGARAEERGQIEAKLPPR